MSDSENTKSVPYSSHKHYESFCLFVLFDLKHNFLFIVSTSICVIVIIVIVFGQTVVE